MIDKSEIMDFSREFGLAPNVVEKDYVLGWVLAGIFNHTAIGARWVFKGGTCLKKCYFETYRFSEDLDFTIDPSDGLDQGLLTSWFKEISAWVYDTAGIEIPEDLIRFDVYLNHRGGLCAQGRVAYRGPLNPRRDMPRIKLDLTTDEILVLDPTVRAVHHPYSDGSEDGMRITSYSFEEVFAEKVRALAERQRPRDLYDVVHLYRHDESDSDQPSILSTLDKKCAFKKIAVPTMDTFHNRPAQDELEAEWENMLAHQLPALPSFDQFWLALPEVMAWLHGVKVKTVKAAISTGRRIMDETWRPPAMAQAWRAGVPLERIRFAAANRLCVDLQYNDTVRLIEPYSMRRTRDGNILLFAVRHETGETRAYRVDRIQGAEIAKTSYVPRYAVELTPTGPMSTPDLQRGATRIGTVRPVTKYSGAKKRRLSGPIYVIECPYCTKRFNRKKSSTRLNPHKDKNGYPCPNRSGYLVETKY